jgi:hypothetical protein
MWVAGILLDLFPGVVIRAIRETFSAVEQNLVAKFLEIYPEKTKSGERIYQYNKGDNIITWHNGSKLIFDYSQSLRDAMSKQGLEQDILMIDEVVSHQVDEIKYLINRTRSNIPEIGGFGKIIFTGNPIGPSLNYVRKEFVESTEYGKYYALKKVRSRVDPSIVYEIKLAFIEAKLIHNKYLMETGYEANILELSENLQKVYLDGDWYVSLGAHFDFEEKYHTYKKGEVEIKDEWRKAISMDWGINDKCSIHWYAIDEDGVRYVYREYYQNNKHIEDVGAEILALTEEEIEYMILPHDLYRKQVTAIRNEDGIVVGDTPAEVLEGIVPFTTIRADSSKGSRKRGWRACHRMLYLERDDDGYKKTRIRISEECPNLISQLKTIESKIEDPEEIKDNQEDHAVDDFRYYCDTSFTNEHTPPKEPKDIPGTPGYWKEKLFKKKLNKHKPELYY